MRLFSAAIALLFLGVANAIPEYKLTYPKFETKKTHLYDVWINSTSGVPGMDPQVSKSVIKAELHVYAQTQTVLIIRLKNVKVTGSIHRVGSAVDPMRLKPDADLEKHLQVPIKCTYEKGLIKTYTLANDETLESKKIKKAILRNFQIRINETVLKNLPDLKTPLHFNVSRSSPYGNYSSHYLVMSNPYPEFPIVRNVYNISRTDNFEVSYPAYHTHHNFEKQGCPGVCRMVHEEDGYHSGCPIGWEPYQTPMKKSFVQHHNLRILKSGISLLDIIHTKETHVADLYDQNMEVVIKYVNSQKLLKNASKKNLSRNSV
ncbi:uncharacterized protein TNIN_267821 [Trichonephila inaurata madagascariensis]|uniref:Vitellogenin domain-containing protein n=1 Tax=Trichonephila inaurata madagascariensis TaxID=2747483 RepID=A0A8X6WY64_9ARAC|nr:uncharacterized protein TNIN_267821 [Trichonephila inaurata madagascariensis]